MRYCLVTGGAGFIGSHLVEHLVRDGWNVRVLDNLSTGKVNNLKALAQQIDFVQGNINDPSVLRAAVAGCDVVFHLAALPSVARVDLVDPRTTHEVCATGTLSVLDAARQMGVRRVIYAASSSAYGGTPGALRSESDPLAPLSPYASSKLSGELYCQSFTTVYGLETVRLRFFNVFGPRQDARSPYTGVIALFIAGMLADKQPMVQGDGLQSRDFTYVENAVQALMRGADAPAAVGQVYNIGNGDGDHDPETRRAPQRHPRQGFAAQPRPGARRRCAPFQGRHLAGAAGPRLRTEDRICRGFAPNGGGPARHVLIRDSLK